MELGEVFRPEDAFLPVPLFLSSVLCGHQLHLFAERLNLGVFFIQQAFLLLDFFDVYSYLFCGNQAFVKGTPFIVGTIAVVNPLDELKQAPQRSKGVAFLHAPFRMYRQIAQLDDKGQLAPGVVVHGRTKGGLVDKGLQVVLVGHFHGAVGGIDPLNRQFQRLAAADSAHGRSGGVDFFGFHAGRGEEGVFGF